MNEARTLGELKKSGQPVLTVREEMRKNLVACLQSGQRILPGIVGYDETVIPDIENAILSGHHMVFLGERGQAKSRIIRGLVSLLDERIPIVKGCEISDNPFTPICRACRRRLEQEGDANFMPVVGETRVISQHLLDSYDRLSPLFQNATAADHG